MRGDFGSVHNIAAVAWKGRHVGAMAVSDTERRIIDTMGHLTPPSERMDVDLEHSQM